MTTCPRCHAKSSRIIDSRVGKSDTVRRRRSCPTCKNRWSTLEIPIDGERSVADLIYIIRKISEVR